MTYKELTEKEKQSQTILDDFYVRNNWKFDRSVACKQYDLIINNVLIEEKFRYENYNDFLIELLQDVITCNLGWYYKTGANYLFYIVKDEYLYSLNWLKFKEWFIGELKKGIWFKPIISAQGFGYTMNLAIKWDDIPKDFYKLFDLQAKLF